MSFGRPRPSILGSILPSGRIVVGMTTLPSRLGLIGPALDSLFAQSVRPDEVFLSLPAYSERERAEYVVEPELEQLASESPLTLLRGVTDHGPGTKLLGCLEHLRPDDILILLDDDMEYQDFVIGELAGAVRCGSDAASFYVAESRGIRVGHGADGFAMLGAAAMQMRTVLGLVESHRAVRMHDDYWISFILQRSGVCVRDLSPRLARHGAALAYEKVHEVNSLVGIDGAYSRERVSREASHILYRGASPTPRMWGLRMLGMFRGARRKLDRWRTTR